MNRSSIRGLSACGAAAMLLASCTEPRVAQSGRTIAPTGKLEPRLELSDSAAAPGATVLVTVRMTGQGVASATGRIVYDPAGLEFVAEHPMDDGATRVVNPESGNIRFAAVAPQGFADGRVEVLRFTVRSAAALRRMTLAVDEAHSAAHTDAAASIAGKTP